MLITILLNWEQTRWRLHSPTLWACLRACGAAYACAFAAPSITVRWRRLAAFLSSDTTGWTPPHPPWQAHCILSALAWHRHISGLETMSRSCSRVAPVCFFGCLEEILPSNLGAWDLLLSRDSQSVWPCEPKHKTASYFIARTFHCCTPCLPVCLHGKLELIVG